jgi:hypothetical protein
VELSAWLKRHEGVIVKRWSSEIRIREGRRAEELDGILETYLQHLVSFLPLCLGKQRDEAEDVWQQATNLYGSISLRRGLAAGEVVEEIQLLREVILRLLLEDPPQTRRTSALARDALVLNRVLDLGVVRASVSYIDDLFFTQLQGSGVAESLDPELVEETKKILAGFRADLGLDPHEERSSDAPG